MSKILYRPNRYISLTMAQKVYVAGPMRGIPKFNFPEFDKATKALRSGGFEVVSPADMDRELDGLRETDHVDYQTPPKSFAHYMQRDLPAVCAVDAVGVLPGWETSQGARLEVFVARALSKIVFEAYSHRILHDEELSIVLDTHKVDIKFEGVAKLDSFYPEGGTRGSNIPRGIGGAPIRASILPDSAKDRKQYPIASGLLDYFPDACCAVANVSYVANEQHNPGKPMHWDRSKSGDESDTLGRHLLQRGARDKDGLRHSAKLAWRAMALLQKEIEQEVK